MDLEQIYPANGSIAIRLQDLTLDYGAHEVVKNVSLNIQRGETKIILGPSGVGKSTILKAILGLLKPRSGEIFVGDKPISGLSEKKLIPIRRKMSMVFQHGALFDAMTVSDNVSFRMREMSTFSSVDIHNRVAEVLKFVGLQNSGHLHPSQLSGGMKKRVAIARALAPDPEIFLFDEPTVGLDPINLYNTEQLILRLKKRPNTTIVIVTHDIESAFRLADSMVMLHSGKFIFDGPPKDLRNAKDMRIRAFLDPANMETVY